MGAASASAYALLITRPSESLGSKYANPIHRFPCLPLKLPKASKTPQSRQDLVHDQSSSLVISSGLRSLFKRQFHELCRPVSAAGSPRCQCARGAVGSAETRDRENVLLDQFSPSAEDTGALLIMSWTSLKTQISSLSL